MKPYNLSRRELLKKCGCGFGYIALTSLLAESSLRLQAEERNSLAARPPMFKARAKRVIFLFMHGGPSHLETFDPKPLLTRDDGKAPPAIEGKIADPNSKLLGPRFKFSRNGGSGLEISNIFPELSKVADDLCVIRSMYTNGQDHGQAVLKLHTGNETQVRPSMGAWILYGLGTENQNLPGFVTISPTPITGGVQNYGAGFLPAVYQGTAIGAAGAKLSEAQIRHIRNAEMPANLQRRQLDLIQAMNQEQLKRAQADSQIEGVIQSYKLAFRMQTEAPHLTDISEESQATLDSYGIGQGVTDDFGRQCLLARRFAERGVRFIQASHSFKWDQHLNLTKDHEKNAREIDKPIAGLLKDLKARGLLQDTLVVWGGEFGRTPTAQGAGTGPGDGRDHNPNGFSFWMAGAGLKGGYAHGATDDYGFAAVQDKVHMHDLHATILYLLGLDHEKLTYRYAGRDFRLTDVHGQVVKAIMA